MTTSFPLLIVDDEPLAIRRLEIALEMISGVHCVGSARSCRDAVSKYSELRPDIVLLDICMKNGDGFEFLESLPAGAAPSVVFVTAFDHFAARAFDVCAADYVLKPVETERLKSALDRARSVLQHNEAKERIAALHATVDQLRGEIRRTQSGAHGDIWVNGPSGTHIRVPIDEIDFVTSEGEYVRIHTKSRSHLVRTSLSQLEEKLDSELFVRTHRSAIVRFSTIRSFGNKLSGGAEVRLRDGATVPLGRVYATRLKAFMAMRKFRE